MVLSGFETTCFWIWDIEIYILVSVVAQHCATLRNVAQLNCLNADVEYTSWRQPRETSLWKCT